MSSVDRARKMNLEIYAGIEDIDKALIPALHVWNSFWGPLGKSNITKKTLLNNSDIVFSLIEAAVPSLISKCIESEDECATLEADIDTMHFDKLSMLSAITKLPSIKTQCSELVYDDCDDNDDVDTPKDDTHIVKKVQDLPQWELRVQIGDATFVQAITHMEYCTYFGHVTCTATTEDDEL